MKRPFDPDFIAMMHQVSFALFSQCQGCKLAYMQSDEISLLLWPWTKHESQAWFDNELPKIVSLSAAIATAEATSIVCSWDYFRVERFTRYFPLFDSRAFVMPEDDVENYFIWRQQDWERNSLNMLCQAHYSHAELHGKSNTERHEMLYAKGVNWNDLPDHLKRGHIITDESIGAAPIFKDNRELLRGLMNEDN